MTNEIPKVGDVLKMSSGCGYSYHMVVWVRPVWSPTGERAHKFGVAHDGHIATVCSYKDDHEYHYIWYVYERAE